jgi:hypothetical protein
METPQTFSHYLLAIKAAAEKQNLGLPPSVEELGQETWKERFFHLSYSLPGAALQRLVTSYLLSLQAIVSIPPPGAVWPRDAESPSPARLYNPKARHTLEKSLRQ